MTNQFWIDIGQSFCIILLSISTIALAWALKRTLRLMGKTHALMDRITKLDPLDHAEASLTKSPKG